MATLKIVLSCCESAVGDCFDLASFDLNQAVLSYLKFLIGIFYDLASSYWSAYICGLLEILCPWLIKNKTEHCSGGIFWSIIHWSNQSLFFGFPDIFVAMVM